MHFLTFIILILIIIVAGDLLKKSLKGSQTNNAGMTSDKEIEELSLRFDELDNYIKNNIEKRIQAIETIVVDREYNLEMKFKKVFEGETMSKSQRQI